MGGDTVYVFLAQGFEETEAVTPVDLLRRGGVPVVTVGLAGRAVTGAHGITLQADMDGADFELPADAAMVVLPGGGEGTENLRASAVVAAALAEAAARGLWIAALCAAPCVLHAAGLLRGRRAAAFPSVRRRLAGALVTDAAVEVDGNIITGRSAGVALGFGRALLAALRGEEPAERVVAQVYP